MPWSKDTDSDKPPLFHSIQLKRSWTVCRPTIPILFNTTEKQGSSILSSGHFWLPLATAISERFQVYTPPRCIALHKEQINQSRFVVCFFLHFFFQLYQWSTAGNALWVLNFKPWGRVKWQHIVLARSACNRNTTVSDYDIITPGNVLGRDYYVLKLLCSSRHQRQRGEL